MAFVFGGVLILSGAMLVALAYHNQISQAWTTLIS